MDIILIRHGETDENVLKTFSTKSAQLTQEGKEQIKRIRPFVESLSFDKVYISPLDRTRDSAKILGVEGEVEKRIQEVDFGDFEGKTYKELKEMYPEEVEIWDKDYINYITPKGESIKLAYDRVTSFLEELVKKGEDSLLVCHAGVIKIALSWAFDNLDYFFKFYIENGSANIISIDDEGFKYIKKMNYTL
ncbi:MAG: histidine phosphatase family protein [Tissierellia bacterium]|nr:histidine phosphatase family protein [Tissierellia bacterium]